MLKDLLEKNRSYRGYDETRKVTEEELRELFPELGLKPEEVRRPGTLMERMAREVPQLHPRLIPYKTASTEQGMLLALRPEWMQVDGKEEKMLVAFSPVTVSDGGGYQALLGGVR